MLITACHITSRDENLNLLQLLLFVSPRHPFPSNETLIPAHDASSLEAKNSGGAT